MSDQTVGLLDRAAGVVDECDLDRLPAPAELRALVIAEQPGIVVAGRRLGPARRRLRLRGDLGPVCRSLARRLRGRFGDVRVAVASVLVGFLRLVRGGRRRGCLGRALVAAACVDVLALVGGVRLLARLAGVDARSRVDSCASGRLMMASPG